MSHFELLVLGHPHLRRVSAPVDDVSSPTLQTSIDTLFDFMEQRQGVGIAAPQVDWPVQLFIMASKPNLRYPDAPMMAPTVIINPDITYRSEQTNKDWEGCLSVPGLRGLVARSDVIDVRYTTRDGELMETRYEGFLARVFQHEYDHLCGKLFVDHVDSSLDLMVESEWRRQILRQS